ncbi:MAG: hypothetical protein NDJ89_15210 [Oligoflexia bacterium]|nr:hypothetical protein [Oligoflexia bacterium]
MRPLTRVLTGAGLLVALFASGSLTEHERLRIRNTFQRPEEVVSYYCSRDASGFVWSGLLEAERKAFTLWEDIPQQDTFFVASKYEIQPPQLSGRGDEAQIQVRYRLVALGDAHGTRMPVHPEDRTITYVLKKVSGAWKIAQPGWKDVAPIVLEGKFQ